MRSGNLNRPIKTKKIEIIIFSISFDHTFLIWNQILTGKWKEKIYKYVETKQHTSEQPMGQSNKNENQGISKAICHYKLSSQNCFCSVP